MHYEWNLRGIDGLLERAQQLSILYAWMLCTISEVCTNQSNACQLRHVNCVKQLVHNATTTDLMLTLA